MEKLLFFCLTLLISLNVQAIITLEEKLFLNATSKYIEPTTYDSIASDQIRYIVDEDMRRYTVLLRCKDNYHKTAKRLTDQKYHEALEKSIDQINALANSSLIPENARTYQELTWLLAYRHIDVKNDPDRSIYHKKLEEIKFKNHFDLNGNIDFYENLTIDISTGENLPNSLHIFRNTLDALGVYEKTQTAMHALGYANEFKKFTIFTNHPFNPNKYDETAYSLLDKFFTKEWLSINAELVKQFVKNDLKITSDFNKSVIYIAQAMSKSEILRPFSDSIFRASPYNTSLQSRNSQKILKLLNQFKYSDFAEKNLINDIPSIDERVKLNGMVNTIIKDNVIGICQN